MGMIWSSLWPFALFAVGVVIVIWATERLLEGLVGLAGLLRVSIFAIAAVLSGFEAENVAVGLAAARREAAELALGTVFGGAIFLVCVALGLGTLLYPLRVTLPRGFLFLMAICPLLVGAGLIGENEPPGWGGVARRLCGRYRLPRAYLSGPRLSGVRGGEGAEEEPRSYTAAIGLTIAGLVVIALGGELVTRGAEGIVSVLGLSTLLVGMVVTPRP